MRKIIIAIDGYSSCGKSTLAKALAKELHYAYVDTGAMYRAVTLYFLDNDLDINDKAGVLTALENIEIHFERTPQGNHVFLNGIDVENEVRTMRVSEMVSPVSTISVVRRAMVAQQQKMGNRKGVVMDGRDIGTVVFPNAELKIFLTADTDIRAKRRFDEMKSKGQETPIDDIRHNLLERDLIDSNRADSPLRQADDAILIDNSYLTPDEQLKKVLDMVMDLKKVCPPQY
jgi:CMP/dCMP kinase